MDKAGKCKRASLDQVGESKASKEVRRAREEVRRAERKFGQANERPSLGQAGVCDAWTRREEASPWTRPLDQAGGSRPLGCGGSSLGPGGPGREQPWTRQEEPRGGQRLVTPKFVTNKGQGVDLEPTV